MKRTVNIVFIGDHVRLDNPIAEGVPRRCYVHVGMRHPQMMRGLSATEEIARGDIPYIGFEPFGDDRIPRRGRFWTSGDLARVHAGCFAISELTNQESIDVSYHEADVSHLRCQHCREWFSSGEDGEFVWVDTASRVGVTTPKPHGRR